MPQSKSKRSRYTAPAPKKAPRSKLWVPATMFTCFMLGLVVITSNYLQLLPGGDVTNTNLVIGIVLIIGGFVLSTFLR